MQGCGTAREKHLKFNKVDKRPGFIRLRWHRSDKSSYHLSPSKEYAIVPADS